MRNKFKSFQSTQVRKRVKSGTFSSNVTPIGADVNSGDVSRYKRVILKRSVLIPCLKRSKVVNRLGSKVTNYIVLVVSYTSVIGIIAQLFR